MIYYDIYIVVETQQSWRLDKFCSLEKDAALEDTSSSSSNSIRSSATERAVYKGNTDPHDKVSAIPEVVSYSIIIRRSAYNHCYLSHHLIDTILSSINQASPHGIAELGNSVIGIITITIITIIISSSSLSSSSSSFFNYLFLFRFAFIRVVRKSSRNPRPIKRRPVNNGLSRLFLYIPFNIHRFR